MPKKPRLKFKPILLKRGVYQQLSMTEMFALALKASERIAVMEGAKKITFTLTKARTKVV